MRLEERAKLMLQELCVVTDGAEGQLNVEWILDNLRAVLEEAAKAAEQYDLQHNKGGSLSFNDQSLAIAASIRSLGGTYAQSEISTLTKRVEELEEGLHKIADKARRTREHVVRGAEGETYGGLLDVEGDARSLLTKGRGE